MGCDYYVVTDLEIKLKDNDCVNAITVYRENMYFYYDEYDSDEDDYYEKRREHRIKVMEDHNKPNKVVYEKDQFINNTCKDKYTARVLSAIHSGYWGTDTDPAAYTMADVDTVTKVIYAIERE